MTAIGIDLGTTNSCMAAVEGGQPEVIPNIEGERTTPSVVGFTKNGERLVGTLALRQNATNPNRTISSIKRQMGTQWRMGVDGKEFSPQTISAMILRKLRSDAEKYLNQGITDAVITVPAYFNDMQRTATKDAGTIAGLNVLRIINEPTAAALAYGLDHGDPQIVMVYDFGGGTFDVSVIEIDDNVIEVLATAGNNELGGDDFDAKLTDFLIDKFYDEHGVNLADDALAYERVREAAEQAKRELSSLDATIINLPFIAQNDDGPLHMEETVTRDQFIEMVQDLIEATTDHVHQALNDAGIAASELGEVILVGGTTRIPAVQDHVRKLTGKEPNASINPDECVAQGAAIQAATLESARSGDGAPGGLLLLDVVPISFALQTVGGVATRVISRNTTLPVHYEQIFTTASSGQNKVEIVVLQGERPLAQDCKVIGRFMLKGVKHGKPSRPGKKAPAPRINVSLDIDANGILTVSAKDLASGVENSITIMENERMTEDEIQSAIQEAEKYEAQDVMRRKDLEIRELASQLYQISKDILKDEKKNMTKDEAKELKAAAGLVRGYLNSATHKMSDAKTFDFIKATVDLKKIIEQYVEF